MNQLKTQPMLSKNTPNIVSLSHHISQEQAELRMRPQTDLTKASLSAIS
jgi:hypothetical protein